MKVYIEPHHDDRYIVKVRAEGPGGIIGDAEIIVGPGESIFGVPYSTIKRHGPGSMEIRTKE